MATYTQRYDDYDPDFVRAHPLPYLEGYGVGMRVHDALDKVFNGRHVVMVVGGKGLGKSVGLDRARDWFHEREDRRAKNDNSYQPLRVQLMTSARQDSYEEVLTNVLHALDRREPTKEGGRRKTTAALRDRIAELMARKRVAILAVDEAETLTAQSLNAYRDIAASSADRAARVVSASSPGAIGLLVAGTPQCHDRMESSGEYGHRIAEVVRLPDVTIKQAEEVLQQWLPQIAGLDRAAQSQLRTAVRVNICRDRSTNMRHLDHIVKEYGRRLDRQGRLKGAMGWKMVPIDIPLLIAVANDHIDPGPGPAGGQGPRA